MVVKYKIYFDSYFILMEISYFGLSLEIMCKRGKLRPNDSQNSC
jgi:hypothetical protein